MFFDIGVRSLYLTISCLRLRLEQSIKEENKSYIKFLESVNFDILDLKKKMEGDIANKEVVVMLSRKMDELKTMLQDKGATPYMSGKSQ